MKSIHTLILLPVLSFIKFNSELDPVGILKGENMKFLISSVFVILSTSMAQANSIEDCLNQAKSWIYSNTSANQNQAAEQAIPFCTKGGDVSCLNPAKSWIYSNTSRNQNDAASAAVLFCARGEVSCLAPTSNWIYSNTSANRNQAAEQAITACSEKKTCEPK